MQEQHQWMADTSCPRKIRDAPCNPLNSAPRQLAISLMSLMEPPHVKLDKTKRKQRVHKSEPFRLLVLTIRKLFDSRRKKASGSRDLCA
jgi:hypothetical protein